MLATLDWQSCGEDPIFLVFRPRLMTDLWGIQHTEPVSVLWVEDSKLTKLAEDAIKTKTWLCLRDLTADMSMLMTVLENGERPSHNSPCTARESIRLA